MIGAALLDAAGRDLRTAWQDALAGRVPEASALAGTGAAAGIDAAATLAEAALSEAGLSADARRGGRLAAVIASTATAGGTGGVAVSRATLLARILGLDDPPVEPAPATLQAALAAARGCLDAVACEAVLVAAFGGPTGNDPRTPLGAALVVAPEAAARRDGRRVYGRLRDGAAAHEPPGAGLVVAASLSAAAGAAGPAPDDGVPRIAAEVRPELGSDVLPGLAALLRAVLALHHRVISPAEGEAPAAAAAPLFVNRTPRPWVHGAGPRRALVAEPAGDGATAPLVAEQTEAVTSGEGDVPWPVELVCLAAGSRAQLLDRLDLLAGFLARHPRVPLAGLARGLAQAARGPERLAVVAADAEDLAEKLARARRRLAESECRRLRSRAGVFYGASGVAAEGTKLAFLYPGQGSQVQGMGGELAVYLPPVRAWLDRLDATFAEAVPPSALLLAPAGALDGAARRAVDDYMASMEGGAQAGFLLNLAFDAVLRDLGLVPDALLGYSNGENSALIAAGALSDDPEVIFDCLRRLRREVAGGGAAEHIPRATMMAVGLAEPATLRAVLDDMDGRLHLAMDNCPGQVVLCGARGDVDAARERLQAAGAVCVLLPFDRAYHTPWFEKKAGDFRDIYDALEVGAPRTPVYSCASAAPFPAEAEAIRELATRQWHSRVRFRETVERMYADGVRVFVEAGPASRLSGFVGDTLRGREHLALPVNRERRGELRQLLDVVGQLYVEGLPVEPVRLFRHRSARALRWSEVEAAAGAPVAADAEVPEPLPEPSSPARPQAPAPRAPDAARADLAAAHGELMREFLGTQERVFAAFAARRGGGAAVSETQTVPEAGAAAALLGRVLAREPGRLLARRRFTAGEPFLADHQLGRRTSRLQPDLALLSVVPFAFAMEAAAEAAVALAGPGWRVAGLSEVRALQWLALDRGTLDLDVEARAQGEAAGGAAAVRVRLREAAAEPARGALAFEATVHLGRGYPTAPAPQPAPEEAARPARWSAEGFYDYCSFHGPALQSVERVHGTGPGGMQVELRVPAGAALAGTAPEELELPAQLLDAAGQIVGYWLVEEGHEYFGTFPVALDSYRQYGPPPAAGARLACAARLVHDGQAVAAELDIVDADGRLLARLRGLRSRYFDYGERFFFALFYGSALARPVIEDEDVAAVALAPLAAALLCEGGGIWLRALAHKVLAPREREAWSRLPAEGEERGEALHAALAAKELLCRWARRARGRELAAVDVALVADGEGWYAARCPALEATGPVPRVRVAACRAGWAAAVALAPGRLGLGCRNAEDGDAPEANRRCAEDAIADARARASRSEAPVRGEAHPDRLAVALDRPEVPVYLGRAGAMVVAACLIAGEG